MNADDLKKLGAKDAKNVVKVHMAEQIPGAKWEAFATHDIALDARGRYDDPLVYRIEAQFTVVGRIEIAGTTVNADATKWLQKVTAAVPGIRWSVDISHKVATDAPLKTTIALQGKAGISNADAPAGLPFGINLIVPRAAAAIRLNHSVLTRVCDARCDRPHRPSKTGG